MTTPNQAFERELGYVLRLVGNLLKTRAPFIERREAQTVALGGLWSVSLRYHQLPPEQFRRLVRQRVSGAIADQLRAQDWLPRKARAAHPDYVNFEFDELKYRYVTEERDEGPDDLALERMERLRSCLSGLPPRWRRVIELRHFTDPPMRLRDIGAQLGVTEARASQLHTRAMAELRARVVHATRRHTRPYGRQRRYPPAAA